SRPGGAVRLCEPFGSAHSGEYGLSFGLECRAFSSLRPPMLGSLFGHQYMKRRPTQFGLTIWSSAASVSESAAMMKWTPPGERTAWECHTPEPRGSEGGVHERSYDQRGRHRQERIRDRRLGGAGPRSRAAATFAAPDDQMVRESSGVDGGDGGLRIRAPSRTAFRELRAPGGAAAAGAGAALRAAQQDGSNRHDGATGGTSERRHRGGAGEDDPSAEPLGDASAENGVERDADGATERATRCAARVRDRDRGRRDEGAARGGRGDLEGRSARSPARAADRGDGGDPRARREDRQGRARVGDPSRGPAGIRAAA